MVMKLVRDLSKRSTIGVQIRGKRKKNNIKCILYRDEEIEISIVVGLEDVDVSDI